MTLKSKSALQHMVIKHSSDRELEQIIERIQHELETRRRIDRIVERKERANQVKSYGICK